MIAVKSKNGIDFNGGTEADIQVASTKYSELAPSLQEGDVYTPHLFMAIVDGDKIVHGRFSYTLNNAIVDLTF